MLLRILRFILGYVKVEVFGFAPERLMNLIAKNDIIIWEIERIEHGYSFYTGRKNLLKMKPYLQKTNMKLKLIDKCGLPYVIKRNRKRAAFIVGFGIFVFMIYIMSLFVWEVRIVGEDKLVADNILECIEKKYVPLGTLKKNIDCNTLEEALRKEFDDISWISCELKGTGLTVYLEEGMAPKNNNTKYQTGDIVAAKDATITKMITREGTPVAKVNDTVKKGDILISGTIYIYDDNNEILETSYIAADGDVYGTTTYTYDDYIDLVYYDKQYAKDFEEYITFYVMEYCFTPVIPKAPTMDYDIYTEIHKAKIFESFYLPFGYKKTSMKPYTLHKETYSQEDAKKILEKRLNKKIKDFKEKGVEIVKNDVTIEQDENRLVAKGTLILKESIVSFKQNAHKNYETENIE